MGWIRRNGGVLPHPNATHHAPFATESFWADTIHFPPHTTNAQNWVYSLAAVTPDYE